MENSPAIAEPLPGNVARALLLLGSLFLSPGANALNADDAALVQRLPASMKLTTQEAKARIQQWQAFVAANRHKPERDQIVAVNAYFNGMQFVEDVILWHRQDYWATPLQVLVAAAGDCEDFAIAKYFTLREMGVPNDRLRITYVWNYDTPLGRPQPHMVLTYATASKDEPMVLDILTRDIETLKQRTALEPVYALNSERLWVVVNNTQVIPAGSPVQLSAWRRLSRAMAGDKALLRAPDMK